MPSRLKSLELHGYKTFASRTLFEFASTVTAVVGPNGSGKSNIADSLRWVLGEQSYSLLRGKKTEDMIFSGSEQRTRAGMASATVVFDNTDNWLPIDFSEVAITRRAYRDGQNEYLINAQKVRLKDVSELLAQSGLAERTYTVIGQGLVDAALALKAEERRRLFEEAAGIGLHRARREEALRRLETTHRNLDRVQDILAELQPRLRSLERQARRAQEYEQVRADLRVLLRDWYGYHWHHAQKDLREAREHARREESALEKARRVQSGLNEKLSGMRDHIQSLRARLNSWHRQQAQLHSQRESLSRQLAVINERMHSMNEQQNSLQSDQIRLEEELGLNQQHLDAAAQEVARLESELQEARDQAAAARKALQARQGERAEAEKRLQAVRQTLNANITRQGQLEARITERRAQAERQQLALDEAIKAADIAKQELRRSKDRYQELLKARDQALQSRQASGEVLLAHRQRISEVEAARKDALELRSRQTAEMARLRAQMDVLEQAEAALVGYASGTQALLKAARQNRLSGARSALSSNLEVPIELETAIAAALGEYLDAVILDAGERSEQALDILESEGSRGALLPLDTLTPVSPWVFEGINEAGNAQGVIGLAADLVKAPPELRPALDLLLGQTVIVKDRKAARYALADGKRGGSASLPANLRAVTLRGEVFYANGPILAGQEGKSSTLSRPRQMRELQKSIQLTSKKLEGIKDRLTSLDAEIESLLEQDIRLEDTLNKARQALEGAEGECAQQKAQVDQIERQERWQTAQRERLESEIAGSAQEASRLSGELAQVEKDISLAREDLREQNNLLSGLTLDEFQSQTAHWETLSSVIERTLEDSKVRRDEQQAMFNRANDALASAQARLRELEQGLVLLESEKTAQRLSESEIGTQIDALRQLIEPSEIELDEAENEQERLQNEEAASRQALSNAEHRHAQARINLARRQEALEALRRRVEDDFGLVAFEYEEEISGPTPLPLEGMVEQLPRLTRLSPDLEDNIKRQRAQLRRMGAINPEAQAEYQEVKERFSFMTGQVEDLQRAEIDIRQVVSELDTLMEREFRRTFDSVAEEFKAIFTRLFGGGSARLVLTDPDDLTNTGIDIEARLPGRRTQGLSLLSGGERSLTAASLVFALLKVSPTPFCILDEVDAMLDEANVGRFRDLLAELSSNTQFIVVTHNRNTVQAADVIYGVTMGRDSVSQVISLKLDQVGQVVE
jgi:chromosome segregation protein